jgi:prolyl-tRNA editing enzyme YbaK/EbsC (Cys-tRNA(Pro) deacylase)
MRSHVAFASTAKTTRTGDRRIRYENPVWRHIDMARSAFAFSAPADAPASFPEERGRDVTDLSHPGIQRVVEVASRKGVALDIRLLPASTHTPEETAAILDAHIGQIVKSLVFVAPRPDGRLVPIVCLVSGRNQVDLGLLTAVSGEVALRAATAREVHELTAFSMGGLPPFGYGRNVRVLMDQDLAQYESVWAAAGADSAVLKVAPGTLRMLSNAIVAPVADAAWMHASGPVIEPRLQFEAGTGA